MAPKPDTDENGESAAVVYRVDGLSKHECGHLLSAVGHEHGRDSRLYGCINDTWVRGTEAELREIAETGWSLAVSNFDTTLGRACEAIASEVPGGMDVGGKSI